MRDLNKSVDTSEAIGGVWPALITPLNEDQTPNFVELEKLVNNVISLKLDGLYILGSTGQGFLLSDKERREVAECILSVNNGRVPAIVQVGSMTTRQSIALAKHAAKCGAYGISSVGPIYYNSNDGTSKMALKHYHEIAESTELPFFPYQIGGMNYSDSISEFIRELMKISNVRGMKLTTTNLLEISAISYSSKRKLTLFSGSDELLCHAVLSGTSGAIGTMYNLWGEECRNVREEFVNGNVRLGTSFMLTFQEVIEKILPNIWTFLREALKYRYEIDIGRTIHPLGNTHKEWDRNEIIQIVDSVVTASKETAEV